MDFARVDALAHKILVAIGRGREQQIGQLIGQQAVDFFRHAAVTRAQTGLNVGDANTELGAHQRGSHRGVDVAIHENEIRLLLA